MQAEQLFTEGSASVSAARRFVSDVLATWGLQDAVWDAQLLVSELATNAVLHAGTAFTVVVSTQGEAVRLEVGDGMNRSPRERHYGPDATTGRGIGLVAALSQAWGVVVGDPGKRVWCELPATTASRTDLEASSTAQPDLDRFPDAPDRGEPGGGRGVMAVLRRAA